VAEAKSTVCTAYGKMRRALDVNATRNGGDDPNTQLLVAVNARQVFVAGSAPSTDDSGQGIGNTPDLAAATQKVADLSQVITLDGLVSDSSIPAQNALNETG
jgi:hypothetical protein